ncbi:MAG: hypothetical protein JNJ39_09845 [Blastocatellia bacterium]|nr:hypothetical protein [Blastocatellia bacterium]
MKRIHLIFGVLLFVVFAMTGRYMRADFPDKEAIDQTLRVLMRSRHIYILFSALIHIVLGSYLVAGARPVARVVQYAGSAILFTSSVLLVWAFVSETYALQHYSDYSRYGIYTSLGGVLLHLVGGIGPKHDH